MRWGEARDLVPVLTRRNVLLHHVCHINAERSLIQLAGEYTPRGCFAVLYGQYIDYGRPP